MRVNNVSQILDGEQKANTTQNYSAKRVVPGRLAFLHRHVNPPQPFSGSRNKNGCFPLLFMLPYYCEIAEAKYKEQTDQITLQSAEKLS